MRPPSLRLQAQDEKLVAALRRAQRQRRDIIEQAGDALNRAALGEIAPPRNANKMRPYVFGEER